MRTLGDKSSSEKRAKCPVTHMPSRRSVRSVAFVGLVLVHNVGTGKFSGLKEWVSERIQESRFRRFDDGKRVEKVEATVQVCRK